MKIIAVDFNGNRHTNIEELERLLAQNTNSVAAIAYQNTSFFGQLKEQKKLISLAHVNNSLIICTNPDLLAFGLTS